MKKEFKIIDKFFNCICNGDAELKNKLMDFLIMTPIINDDSDNLLLVNIIGIKNPSINYFMDFIDEINKNRKNKIMTFVDDGRFCINKDDFKNYEANRGYLVKMLLKLIFAGSYLVFVNEPAYSLENLFKEEDMKNSPILTINLNKSINLTDNELRELFNENTIKEFSKYLDDIHDLEVKKHIKSCPHSHWISMLKPSSRPSDYLINDLFVNKEKNM